MCMVIHYKNRLNNKFRRNDDLAKTMAFFVPTVIVIALYFQTSEILSYEYFYLLVTLKVTRKLS